MPKWHSKHKLKSKEIALQRVAERKAAMAYQRDTILESDNFYVDNLRALNRRISSGKVPSRLWKSIRDSLAMTSLRRAAGYNLRQSIHLMAL